MNKFVGRKKELEKLISLHRKKSSKLVVIKGRRRIGKSRLVEEFSYKSKGAFWNFSGLASFSGISNQDQLDHFSKQISLKLNIPQISFRDWSDALEFLSMKAKNNDIILFDEISWMGEKDASFVAKLKSWWDKQNKDITLIFCGSVSTWIEENILNSTAFFGRINLTITLEPLSIPESKEMIISNGFKGSNYDIYKLMSILGGIPWYLKQIRPGLTADEIIKQLCFQKDGILVLEFERIFNDLFNKKGPTYKKVLNSLKDGSKTLSEIRKDIGFSKSGSLSKVMNNLIVAEFVKRQNLWSFKTGKNLKKSLFRISDPYIRFYLKVISRYITQIENNNFNEASLSNLKGFNSHIGLQIEYLLLQNRSLILKKLNISQEDVILDGPYRQFANASMEGCQIDYLIQTSTKNIFICEFKFSKNELNSQIIEEIKKKAQCLKTPQGYAVVPSLFHLSGTSESVDTNEFLYKVVDINDFLEIN